MKARARRTAAARSPAKQQARGRDEQVRWLLHELQVHSAEITAQNEQLIKAQAEIEESRDRYAELYDFAPMGYLSLDAQGAILECNFAASRLLGRSRTVLLTVPLPVLLTPADRGPLRAFLTDAMTSKDDRTFETEVTTRKEPRKVLRLLARGRSIDPGPRALFTAVVDVTVQRQLDEARRQALSQERGRSLGLTAEVAARAAVERRIKGLLERLVTVQEEERARLSRDLHDHLGQQLTALRLTLSKLNREAGDGGVRSYVEAAERIAAELDKDVDHLGRSLRSAALAEFGLLPALETLTREWSEYCQVPVAWSAPSPSGTRLPPDAENHVYRIVQESLNNVAKHAAATQVAVKVAQSSRALRISIRDDGKGFDASRAADQSSMGLLGMRERAALAGGELQVESTPGRGTVVVLKIPMPPAAPAKPSDQAKGQRRASRRAPR